MSEVIPEYIGSRLSVIEDESFEQPLSIDDNESDTIENDQPKPAFKIEAKKKKSNGMVKKGIKKKKSGTKKLPLNPNAVKSQALSETSEIAPKEPEIKDQPTVEPENDVVADKSAIVSGLKKIPSRKKKIAKPAAKKKIKKEPATVNLTAPKANTEPEIADAAVEETKKKRVIASENSKAPVKKEPIIAKKPQERQETDQKIKRTNSMSEAEERKTYVQNLKKETNDYLRRLAEERKQRQLEYAAFRQKLREDLARK